MKRFFSFGALLLLTVALGSCQGHASYESSPEANTAGASTAGTNTEPASTQETSAQQDQLSPLVDAPNNQGMPADSSTSQ